MPYSTRGFALTETANTYSIDSVEGLDSSMISPRRMAWQRYWHHRGAAVSTIVMAIIGIVVIFAPFTARYGINEQVLEIRQGNNIYLSPRSIAWFGTDDIGRDMYSRLIWGVRTSLFIGAAAAVLSVLIGTTVGAVSGLKGGRLDDVVMRVTDIFLAFPFLISLILLREFMGGVPWLTGIIGEKSSIRFLIFLFAFFGWMGVARLVRGQVMALKEREFIEAARAAGASNRRIIARHLLPNSVGPILVALSLSVIGAIVAESTLSFFGLGPQAGEDSTSLGRLVELSQQGAKQGNWWLVVFPCGFLVLLAVCINFIGDGLRDAFDPKLETGSST